MAKAKVTNLRAVARAANVSIGTASMAFSEHSAIAERTRAQVLRVAEELGYKPNIHARSLASNKSFLLGLLGRESMWVFALDIIRGIQNVCLDRNYSLVTYIHGDSSQNEQKHIAISLERKIDALIIMPALDPDGSNNFELLKSIRRDGYPVMQLFGNIIADIPSVRFDEVEATRQAVRLLIENGHTRIVHVTHDKYNDTRIKDYYYASYHRHQGYELAMKEAGLVPIVFSHTGMAFEQDAALMTPEILNHPSRPTAAVCYSDSHAWGIMKAMHRMGKRCPDDFSLVGSNALEMISLDLPRVTSFNRDFEKQGFHAAKMCFDMLEGKAVEDVVLHSTLKPGGTVTRPPK